MSWVSLAVGAAGIASSAIGGNQARQRQKHADDLASQATEGATARNASLDPIRKLALARLQSGSGQQPDFSSTFAGGPSYRAINDPLVNQGNSAQAKTLASLTDAPDYISQAKQKLADFDTASAPVLDAQYRKVGQRAAALGRLGSGGVTSELGTVLSDEERNRELAKNQYLTDALNQNQSNKYATLNAAEGVTSGAYGRAASERSNEQGVAQQGVSNRAAELAAERGAMNQNFGQAMSLAQLGYSTDPTSALFTGANIANKDANSTADDWASLAAGLGKQFGTGFRKVGTTGTTGNTGYGTPNAYGQVG